MIYRKETNTDGTTRLVDHPLKLRNLRSPVSARRLPRDALRVLVPAELEREFQAADQGSIGREVALCDPVEGTTRRRGCWWIVRDFAASPVQMQENTAVFLLDGAAVFVNEAGVKLARNSNRKDR